MINGCREFLSYQLFVRVRGFRGYTFSSLPWQLSVSVCERPWLIFIFIFIFVRVRPHRPWLIFIFVCG